MKRARVLKNRSHVVNTLASEIISNRYIRKSVLRKSNGAGTFCCVLVTRVVADYRDWRIDLERTHRYNPKNAGADDVGFVDVPAGDEAKLLAAVATQGPVSVAIDASLETFQLYSDGVYYDENCSSNNLDHGVSSFCLQHNSCDNVFRVIN